VNPKPRVKRTFKELFLDKLIELSGGEQKVVNNGILKRALKWKDERYTRIKEELIHENKIVPTVGGPRGAVSLKNKAPEPLHEAEPLHVFVSYSHQDEPIKRELIKHLMPLKRLNLIADWHDRKIEAGDRWEQVISENLKKADIVIVIISIDFINSKYCYDVEMETALDQAAAGQATFIPVIARRCIWKNTRFSSYQALPTDGKAIATWADQDEALSVVAEGVQQVAERIMSSR
jgi:hypothetical protein